MMRKIFDNRPYFGLTFHNLKQPTKEKRWKLELNTKNGLNAMPKLTD